MKAARYIAPGQIAVEEAAMPEPPRGGLLLRMEIAAVCGSDLHYCADSPPESFPWKPGQSGHECVGSIEVSRSKEWTPGARVLVLPPEFNGFAEWVAVDPAYVLALPDGMASELGVLAQQLGTVLFCCRKLQNVLDKRFVVIGQGPAGLLFSAVLHASGARQVIGVDLVEHRLAMARRLGVERTIDMARDDPVEAVLQYTDGHMADGVVEAVGKAETINLCPKLVRQGGEVALFGVPKKEFLPIAMEQFLRKNVRLVASADAQGEPGLRSFRLALDMIASRRIDVRPLITHRLPLSAIAEAFSLAETKRDGAVKVLVDLR